MARPIGFNLLQVLFVVALAPLVSGVLARLKEVVQSRRGPSIFQPYRDLRKFFSKDEIVSEQASWIFRVTPYVVFVAPIFVTTLIPVLTSYPLFFAFMGDMLGGGFVLALGGFFATLAAVDTANPYGPMGASRTRMVGFLAEPVFMIVFFTVSFIAGSTIPYIVQEHWITLSEFFAPSHVLLVIAFVMLILAEAGRIPVDNPTGHFELAMIDESKSLEYSGTGMALMKWGGYMKPVGACPTAERRRRAFGGSAGPFQDRPVCARSGRDRILTVEAAAVSSQRIPRRGFCDVGGRDDHGAAQVLGSAMNALMPVLASLNGLAAGVFLLSAFGLLATRQMQGCVRFFRLQSLALVASIALIAVGLRVPDLLAVALLDLAIKPLLIPWLLRRYVREELFRRREIDQVLNIPSSLLIALALTIIAYFVAVILPPAAGLMGAINVPIGLAGLLLGAFTLAVRREAVPQLIGIFAIENGSLFAGIAIAPRLPLVAEMVFPFDMLIIALVIGILTRITQERVGTTEVGALRSLREGGAE
jgi:formate hydrogenlyase subunit 4/hydrogenase-4 membrane subunit HyfE